MTAAPPPQVMLLGAAVLVGMMGDDPHYPRGRHSGAPKAVPTGGGASGGDASGGGASALPIIIGFFGVVIGTLILPVAGLLMYHGVLIATGQTTKQRWTRGRLRDAQQDASLLRRTIDGASDGMELPGDAVPADYEHLDAEDLGSALEPLILADEKKCDVCMPSMLRPRELIEPTC